MSKEYHVETARLAISILIAIAWAVVILSNGFFTFETILAAVGGGIMFGVLLYMIILPTAFFIYLLSVAWVVSLISKGDEKTAGTIKGVIAFVLAIPLTLSGLYLLTQIIVGLQSSNDNPDCYFRIGCF